jgi:hypothetical protein
MRVEIDEVPAVPTDGALAVHTARGRLVKQNMNARIGITRPLAAAGLRETLAISLSHMMMII